MTRRTVIDEATWNRAHAALTAAAATGRDPVELLHDLGLLRSADRDRKVKIGTIRELAANMRAWMPLDFLGRRGLVGRSATPIDMYRCILEWVEECQKAEEKDQQ